MLNSAQVTNLFPLKVENLSLNFGGRNKAQPLINGMSFTINQSGITAIMGPNGAGKSLTLRLLHGLLIPTSGKINWYQKGENSKQTKAIQNQQAMVFQKPVLLRRSVTENLRYTLRVKNITDKNEQQKLIDEALEKAGLEDQAKNPARRLSGGEQQKLAMVRALMTRPAILFLDEPTASLDPNATKAIEDMVLSASEAGTKIIIVTHDIGQANRITDEIIFLNKGQMTEQGPTKTLTTSPTSKPAKQYFSGKIVLDD